MDTRSFSWLILLTSCASNEPDVGPSVRVQEHEQEEKPGDANAPAAPPAVSAGKKSLLIQTLGTTGSGSSTADLFGAGDDVGGLDAALAGVTDAEGRANKTPDASPTVRAWFPESFLWQPLVQTNDAGVATVEFTVPDTLTTWRILALGQTRQGSQGGAAHTFLSTLPAYVDVVAPLKVRVGDVIELPIQVVNQSADPLRGTVSVKVSGGLGQGGGGVTVAPWGSTASTVHTIANHAGQLVVEAGLTAGSGEPVDTVRKSVIVTPVGRPIEQSRAGTLAGPRAVTFDPVGNALDGSIAVTVFPGALSVLRQELDLAGGRGGDVGSAAYAWRVSQASAPLIAGNEVKPEVARDLGLVALQRLMRTTRTAGSDAQSVMNAALALAGLGRTEGDRIETHLAGRMRDVVTRAQQADGLWSLGSGYGLDEQLVASARCLWALRQSDAGLASASGASQIGPGLLAAPAELTEATAVKGARLRFSGALERFGDRLSDPYVAAWALTSGGADALDAELRARLRKTVQDALIKNADGSLRLDPTLGASSARTLRASTAEATAVALLALTGDDPDTITMRADLATGALGRWSPGSGFGGGWGGLTALSALALSMGGEIPDSVRILLYADDKAVGEGALDPGQKHAPVRLSVPGAAHTLRVEAVPAVPGLAFTAVATSWVPWTQAPPRGLELRVTPPSKPMTGRKDALRIEISGPAGATADVDIALPAGVDVADAKALTATLAATSGTVETEEGAVRLRGLTLVNGVWSGDLPVTPTLGGVLQSGAAIVTLSDGETFTSLPTTWRIGM